MNENDDIRPERTQHAADAPLDAGLRLQLRGLRRELAPAHDLWPEIAARIAASASPAGTPSAGTRSTRTQLPRTQSARTSPRRFAPWALAASLLLAVGVAWQLQPPPASQAGATLASAPSLDREATALTREYRAALQELQAAAPAPQAEQPALRELDRSAAQIRTALARDPDARFLLERLRHTYTLRLALTQRAALT
ncbi:hypothetical protein [Cognatiluteimonas weifangensis]|uniref:hypothetical protein n=1 Tax=Cognatiluteimonas weifangensis TaxID=2303539 RepID=UPI0013140056|nr:hypothetical protein [Luteimonas weifangensis]